MTPSRFGGGCMGWTFAIIFWCIALAALTIVFPIVIIGWVIIIGAGAPKSFRTNGTPVKGPLGRSLLASA